MEFSIYKILKPIYIEQVVIPISQNYDILVLPSLSPKAETFLSELQANEPKLNLTQWLVFFEDSYTENHIKHTAELFGVPLAIATSLKQDLENGCHLN